MESQLSADTLLTEVFSEFTARFVSSVATLARRLMYTNGRYTEVKEMELALVVRYWHSLKASSAFKDKMVEVTSGTVPHAAEIISEIMLRVSVQKA